MRFRLYMPADFAALYAIELVCFDPPFRFPRRYMQRLVDAANAACWIAEDESDMAGFAIVEWTPRPDGVSAYIVTIEVAPAYRRRGVAAELMRCVEASACEAGATTIWLHVAADNAAAMRLYEAHGFV
ncbi:MAG TPA: GNAT family N-acetyltransferase, partial [Terracidiphilus sp.]|nr:GNAT family N-acetyltransferase [Terracidiphilus sp.]